MPPATGAPELFVQYAYDGAANRISESRPGWANPVQYSYQPSNFLRLTARGNNSYSWGPYGQLTGKADGTASVSYGYDPRRLIRQVIVDGSVVESYEYDALGRRIVTSDNTSRTLTFYNGNDVVYEVRQAEVLQGEPPMPVQTTATTCYIVLGGKYMAEVSKENGGPPEKQYIHTDVLGSVRAVTDAEGQVVARFDYEPFGLLIGSTGSAAGAERYTGKPHDSASGLYYFGARYYDPAIGRFVSSDPAMYGTNYYVYCNNSPFTYVDPDGKCPLFILTGIAGAVAGGVYGAYTSYIVTGQIDWGLVGRDALAGGLAGATLGAGTAYLATGNPLASTAAVLGGAAQSWAAASSTGRTPPLRDKCSRTGSVRLTE